MQEIILSKLFTTICLIHFIVLLGETTGMLPGVQKIWTYELKSITSKSSDPEKFKVNFEIERISRGVFAISGDFLFNFDIAEGDSNNVEATSYRSAHGDNDYKVLPFQISATHFYKVLNSYYKDVLMDTLKDCSDLPVFAEAFEPPLEKKVYKLNACQFSQDGLPNYLQNGFYKVVIIGTGDVDWELEVIAEITFDV